MPCSVCQDHGFASSTAHCQPLRDSFLVEQLGEIVRLNLNPPDKTLTLVWRKRSIGKNRSKRKTRVPASFKEGASGPRVFGLA